MQRQEMFKQQKRKREEEAANVKTQPNDGAASATADKEVRVEDEGDKTLVLDANDDSATDEENANALRPPKAVKAGIAKPPVRIAPDLDHDEQDISIGANDPVADFRNALQDARDPAVVIRAMCQVRFRLY